MRAFVTDGDQRPALAVTRSLGRRGITVVVGEEAGRSLASSSAYCRGHVTYPSPRRHPRAFEQFLLELVQQQQFDVIVPVTDVTTHAIASLQDVLRRHCAIAVPPLDAFNRVTDKSTLLGLAAQCGIRTPRTDRVDGLIGLKTVAADLVYPVVIKPVRSRIPTEAGWIAATVHYAQSPDQLWRLYRSIGYLTEHPSLIQQRIVGPGHGVFVIFDRGRLLTAFAHRRVREKPPSGGASVLCESIRVDEALQEAAARLLGAIGWHGVAMLEFKQDAATGDHYLMEVNGRFWGSLQLAIDAGVDFPHLTYQLATGELPDVPQSYRLGVKSRWLLGDLDSLLLRMRNSDADLNLPDGAPSKMRALFEFMKFMEPGLRYDVFSARDPRPFLHEMNQYIRELSLTANRRMLRRFSRISFGKRGFIRPSIQK